MRAAALQGHFEDHSTSISSDPAFIAHTVSRPGLRCGKQLSAFLGSADEGHGSEELKVRIDRNNVRTLGFLSSPGYTQSKLRCDGPAPLGPGQDSVEIRTRDGKAEPKHKCRQADFSDTSQLFDYVQQVVKDLRGLCGKEPVKGLFLGLGAGAMQSYLQQQCPHTPDLTTVDSSEQVLNTAENFFGFRPSRHNRVLTGDAYQELARLRKAGERYDFVVVDTLPNAAPPGAFRHVHDVLRPGGSVFLNWEIRRESELAPHKEDLQLFENGVTRTPARQNVVFKGHKAEEEVASREELAMS